MLPAHQEGEEVLYRSYASAPAAHEDEQFQTLCAVGLAAPGIFLDFD